MFSITHRPARSGVVVALIAAAAAMTSSNASAAIIQYSTALSGPAESPPNSSPGFGFATADYDNVAHTLSLNVQFAGLIGNTTASHIHGATAVAFTGTAGVATTTPTFAGFPLGVTAGNYAIVLDLTQSSSYNAAFVTANGGTPATAEVALTNAIAAGKAYLNIHSSAFPGGEIRGFLQIPAPSAALTLGGIAGIALVRRRR